MIRKKIIELVKDAGDIDDMGQTSGLITENILDSYAILMLVSNLENTFNIKLNLQDDFIKNFDSVDSIEKIVRISLNDI